MPQDMTFLDIRQGRRRRFGQSIYEPFGIAQLEPPQLRGSASRITGLRLCVHSARRSRTTKPVKNLIIPDYTDLARPAAASRSRTASE